MPATETILIPPYGHTLASGIREILANGVAAYLELDPSTLSPLTASANTEFESSDLTGYTQQNSANAATLDADTTRKSHLYIATTTTASDLFGTTATNAPFVHRVVSGDFTLSARIRLESSAGTSQVGIAAQSTATAGIIERIAFYASGPNIGFQGSNPASVHSDLLTPITGPAASVFVRGQAFNTTFQGDIWAKLVRAGNVFTAFYSWNGYGSWVQIGVAVTRNDFSADAKLGAYVSNGNVAVTSIGLCDYMRGATWYPTTSPVSSVVVDSGAIDTTWTPSTFSALVNPRFEDTGVWRAIVGAGTLKYRIAAGNTNPPTLSGATLTEAGVQALGALTGRYLKLEVTYISADGFALPSFCGAKIQRSIIQRPAGRALGRGLAA